MRKNALTICCYICAIGAFGAFFRWLQNQICYDAVTNTMKGGGWGIFILLVMLAAFAVFYMLIKKLFDQNLVPPTKLYEVFHGTTVIFPIAFCIIAVILVLGGISTMLATRFDKQAGLYTIVGMLAIFTGVGFPLICTCAQKRYNPKFISVLMTLPVLLFAFWLIVSYRQNATIPSVGVYSIEIVTICACIVAFFFTSGYAYGVVKPVESMISTMFAAFMCFMTISDSRYFGLQLIIVGTAGMLIAENWMLISNMHEKEETDEDEPVPELPAEAAEDSVIVPQLDDIIEETVAEQTTVADGDDDVKIWKSEK